MKNIVFFLTASALSLLLLSQQSHAMDEGNTERDISFEYVFLKKTWQTANYPSLEPIFLSQCEAARYLETIDAPEYAGTEIKHSIGPANKFGNKRVKCEAFRDAQLIDSFEFDFRGEKPIIPRISPDGLKYILILNFGTHYELTLREAN